MRRGLAQQHIHVSVSSRSSTLLDIEERGPESMVRASVHYYNSEEVKLQKVDSPSDSQTDG